MIATLAIVGLCLALGGLLKGATGAGAPILAVPALAMLFDVQFAVAVMLVPNLITNLLQAWQFRRHAGPTAFIARFSGAGALGVVPGTLVLATLPQAALSLIVAAAVLGYVAFRLARADWVLAPVAARRLSVPAGFAAGALQGASGISAPISLSYLNAMRLDRPAFIATVSIFFATMTALQLPAAAVFGILSWERLVISAVAIVPIWAFMPVGAMLARRFSKETFDRVILALLAVLAVKLVFDGLVG
jgi:uncharacterized protein